MELLNLGRFLNIMRHQHQTFFLKCLKNRKRIDTIKLFSNHSTWILIHVSLSDLVLFLSLTTEAHPRPAKPDPPIRGASISTGSLTPIKSSPILNNGSPTILGKRTYEQHNGLDGE